MKLKAKYLKWVTSPQGPAPYFYRRYPKRVAAIRKNLGKDDKHRKRLPVPLDATDVQIMMALDQANRDFEATCRAYNDGETSKAMAEHDIKKAALALLRQHGLQPGDGAVMDPKDLMRIEDLLYETMGSANVILGENIAQTATL